MELYAIHLPETIFSGNCYSDKPGSHDFKILKKLVLPDGALLRARYPGRPTRDCLFIDPVMDGRSLLKIWNLNKFTGILGVFNCQGAGTWPGRDPSVQNNSSYKLSCLVSPSDIEYLKEISEHFADFSFNTGSVSRLEEKGRLKVTLKVLQCDVFTISPIKMYDQQVEFAPIGLIEMYNSCGAVEAVYENGKRGINVSGKGSGCFGAYSSRKPNFCAVNTKQQDFNFRHEDNLLTLMIPPGESFWDITLHF